MNNNYSKDSSGILQNLKKFKDSLTWDELDTDNCERNPPIVGMD